MFLEIQKDLLAAMVEHDAKGKFAVFCQDFRLKEYERGKLTKDEYDLSTAHFTKELERNVTAYCTCKRIYEAHFGEIPDLSNLVEVLFEYYKIAYGYSERRNEL